jgi:hypothetical protein
LGKTRRLVRGDAASTIEKAGLVPIFPGSANFDPEAFLVLIVITIDNKASKSGERPALDLLRGMSSPWPATQCSRRQLLKELKMRRAGFIAGPSAPPSENGESYTSSESGGCATLVTLFPRALAEGARCA